jgi:hypothetical protein
MLVKHVEIKVDAPTKGGQHMGGTGKKNELPGKNDRKSKETPPPAEDDDVEDGDIATPKRDRDDDDQPL